MTQLLAAGACFLSQHLPQALLPHGTYVRVSVPEVSSFTRGHIAMHSLHRFVSCMTIVAL